MDYTVTTVTDYGTNSYTVTTGEPKESDKKDDDPIKQQEVMPKDETSRIGVGKGYTPSLESKKKKQESEDPNKSGIDDLVDVYEDFGGKNVLLKIFGKVISYSEILDALNKGQYSNAGIKIGQEVIPYSYVYQALYTLNQTTFMQKGIGRNLYQDWNNYRYQAELCIKAGDLQGAAKYEEYARYSAKAMETTYYNLIRRKDD